MADTSRTDFPPHSSDAERAVLGAVLLSRGEAFADIASVLHADDFFLPSHRVIFRSMARMQNPIDLVTLTERLATEGNLQEIGGAIYISHLTDISAPPSSVRAYAEIVKSKSSLRRVMSAGSWTETNAQAGESTAAEIAAEAQRRLTEIVATQAGGLVGFREALRDSYESLEHIGKVQSGEGIATGIRPLDVLIGGMRPADMVLLAGRPSTGKTALALQISLNVCRAGKAVGFFSLEMTKQALVARSIACDGKVNLFKMGSGFLDRGDRVKAIETAARLCSEPLYFDDAMQPPEMMLARAKALQKKVDLGLIVVDYLQLVEGGRMESRVQEVSHISRAIKNMGKQLNVPVLALAQLNRRVEGDREGGCPRLSDLRDSGQIEQDADLVLFLYKKSAKRVSSRSEEETEDKGMQLNIAKHRNGPCGEANLLFFREFCRFESANQEYGNAEITDADLPGNLRGYNGQDWKTEAAER